MTPSTMPPSPEPAKLGIDDLLMLKGEEFVLELIAKAIDGEAFERAARAAVPHPYVLRDGCIWKTFVNRDGIPLDTRLTTFRAVITGEVVETNLLEETRWYEIEAQVGGQTRNLTIPASQFRGLGWLPEYLGKDAVVMPPAEDKEVAAAIQLVSPPDRPVRTRYTNTGWVRHAGQDVFLDAQGVIGSDGRVDGVEMKLAPQLEDYVLEEPETPEAQQKAICASFAILDTAPYQVTVPLLSAPYQATLDPATDSNHLSGGTGSFKTCLTALTAQHFGRKMDYPHLPGNFASTATALRELMFSAKDVVFPIDDYSPPDDYREAAGLEQKADAVFRGVGNRAARSRANRDGSLRAAHPPRALIITNGTQLPRSADLKARMTVIRVRKNAVNREALTRSQQDAAQGLYARAMFGFIMWLARDRPKRMEWYQQRILELRETFQDEGAHPRTAPAMAGKMAALELAIEYACDSGAINDAQADDYLARFETALKELARAQNPDYVAMQSAARFVRLLHDALASGRCHITTREGTPPPVSLRAACGWKQLSKKKELSEQDDDSEQQHDDSEHLIASGSSVGWIEGANWTDLFLNPSESLAVVQKLARDMQQPFNIGERDLHQHLFEDDFLVLDEQAENEKKHRDTLTIRKARLGVRSAVLHFSAPKVLGTTDDD